MMLVKPTSVDIIGSKPSDGCSQRIFHTKHRCGATVLNTQVTALREDSTITAPSPSPCRCRQHRSHPKLIVCRDNDFWRIYGRMVTDTLKSPDRAMDNIHSPPITTQIPSDQHSDKNPQEDSESSLLPEIFRKLSVVRFNVTFRDKIFCQ